MRRIFQLYKTAFAGLPKNIWYLATVMLINRSGTMVVAFLALYCTQYLHQSASSAGIAIAMYGLGAIVGAFLGGKLSDSIGYAKVQVGALIGGGVLFIATSFATNFYLFCTLCFSLAMVNESFRPANTSSIAANTDETNRTRGFALVRLAMNLGWSIGTTLGGILCTINYNLIFLVDGGTSIAAGIAMLFLKFKKPAKAAVADHSNDVSPYSNPPFLIFIFATLLFTFCFFQLFTNLTLFYKKELLLSENLIGIILAINGVLIVLFEMLIVKSLEPRYTKRRIIVIGTLGMALFFAISSLGTTIPALVNALGGMILITVSEMLSLPFMNTYYLKFAGKSNTGKYAAIYTISWSIGQILAGLAGGIIIDAAGFTYLWSLAAALSGITACIYYRVIK